MREKDQSGAAELVPYSQEYLKLLARNGRVKAIKHGRSWYTSPRTLEA